MKKVLFTVLILMFTISVSASRNSDDIVTASNSVLNSYMQDVIGNKVDTTNAGSIMGTAKMIEVKADVIDNIVDTINTELTNTQDKIDVLGSELTNTQDKVDTLGTELTNTQDKVDIIGSELTNTQGKVDIIGTELTNTQEKVDVINSELTNTQEKIDTINTELTNTQDKVVTLGTELTNTQDKIDMVGTELTNTQDKVDVIGTELTNTQEKVDQLTLDVNTNQLILRTNERIVKTNQNHIIIVDSVVDDITLDVNTNQILLRTNERILKTNQNRIIIVDGVVDQLTLDVNTNQILLRTNQAQQDVPGADSAANIHMRDVIGNKTDTHDGDSIYSHVHTLGAHVHNQSRVWPTGAPGTNVESHNTAWAQTNMTNTMVPANAISSDFDIHWLCIEALSANGVYEITLWNMTDGNVEIGRVRVVKNANQDGTMNIPMQTPIQDANDRIGVTQINSAGAGATVTLSIFYHIY